MNPNETTPEEARYWSDKMTLESPKIINADLSEKDLIALNILPENYKRWIKENKSSPGKVFGKKGQGEIFNELQPVFYDRSGVFWLWDDGMKCWKISDEIELLNMIEESTNEDIINSKRRTEIINTLKQQGRKNIPKPIKNTWIQFQDTIYDVITGESLKATPEYFVTNPIPWKTSDCADTPVMDKLFTDWVGKDYIQTLYEIIAYCLLPDYPIHRLFCFVGSGMNGKSCYLNLLKKFVGMNNCTSTELDTLLTSRFEVTKLHKKLVCIMGETNFNQLQKTSILKRLTGGDYIGFEYKNKTPFDDNNYAKILIATNNLPETSDKTLGFYRRWCLVDFPNSFSEEKDILDTIPEEEYNNLAIKSVINLYSLLKVRVFTNEGSIEERQKKYEDKSNFLDKFLKLHVEEEFDNYITVSDFNRKFQAWCKENRHRELSETSIGLELKKKGIEQTRKYFDWLNDGKGGQARVWLGIKWKN